MVTATRGPNRIVADGPSDAPLDESLQPATRREVATVLPDGAVVELHLWCGSVCAVFVSYDAASVDGEWTITGLAGPIAVS